MHISNNMMKEVNKLGKEYSRVQFEIAAYNLPSGSDTSDVIEYLASEFDYEENCNKQELKEGYVTSKRGNLRSGQRLGGIVRDRTKEWLDSLQQ